MCSSQLTEDQAAFIAGLPSVFCDLDYAIRSHEFTQRVANPSIQFAKEAVRIGAQLNLVDIDKDGRARLTFELQRERNALKESVGCVETAEYELAQRIQQRLSAGNLT